MCAGIGDRSSTVFVNKVDACAIDLLGNVTFDLFDDQCTNDFAAVRIVAIDRARSTCFFIRPQTTFRFPQRQHSNLPPIRFIDVIFQRIFDLRWQVFGRTIVP